MTQLFSDGARGELAALINSTDTTIIIVEGGNLFPTTTSGDWFNLVLQDDTGIEVIQCHGHEGGSNTFTDIIRGSGSREFAAGSVVGLRLVANDIANIKYDITQKADDLQTLNDEVAEELLPAGNSLIKPILQKVRNNLKSLFTSVDSLTTTVGDKVDKVAGKSLSTNDYTTVEKTKLSGITAGATVNNTDAYLLNRSNHTGAQAISTVTGLQGALDGKQANLVSGTTIKTVNGTTLLGSGNLTVTADVSAAGQNNFTNRNRFTRGDVVTASTGSTVQIENSNTSPGINWGILRINTGVLHTTANAGNTILLTCASTTTELFKVDALGWSTAINFRCTGDSQFYWSSDERLKKNIKPIPDALKKVRYMGGYEFDWIDKKHRDQDHDIGTIAQRVLEVFPEVVTTRDDGTLAVDYPKLVAPLMQATEELAKQVDDLTLVVQDLLKRAA